MKEHFNKWKIYNKDDNKKNIVKYFKTDKQTSENIKKEAERTWLSQSAIIKNALVEYFNK